MPESLEDLLNRLAKDKTLSQSVEEAVRQGVILPILAQLGWNVYNIYEVIPEFPVENTRVDYCLKIGEKKAVFLEVKRVSEDLERHEKQLLEYSFADGVDIAVLTNGLLWWFYLPLSGGNWQQRKFFTIDIQQQKPEDAAQHFLSFLNREAIESGTALQRARYLQASREKDRLIKKTIPQAWDQLFQKPDDRLVELLSDLVESMCGHRPDPPLIKNYVLEKLSETKQEPSIIYPAPATGSRKRRTSLKQARMIKDSTITRLPRQKGIKVQIGKDNFDAESVTDLYTQVLEFLVESGFIEKLRPYLPYATSKKRFLISTEPRHPQGNSFVVPVEYEGYFMEAHKDYRNAVSSLQKLLPLCGLSVKVIS
jgi:hypothetical protein